MATELSSLNARTTADTLSVHLLQGNWTEYADNIGKYYQYILLDLSKYKNVLCVIPIGVTHESGNGYDGIISPVNKADFHSACVHWSVTVALKINFYANFLILGK